MTSSNDLQALLNLSLLQRIPGDARERVATLLHRVSTPIAVPDGEILLLQGNVGGDMGFVLLRGAVEIDREGTSPIAVSAPALLGEMLQFNPSAQRTATVRVAGDAECLRFPWQDFYAQARRDLSEAEQDMLMDSMERCIWERLGRDTLIDLALFRGVSDQLKLRACLLLQWIVRRAVVNAGREV
ncbi:MAG TPA: cyclic nucleotide-binding domain-containing protein [Candidatus Hydrogenedentes bacterium]|nr:cyclic nucleotide-binding domain-containing protein [Candidatus Hydrogenedentota bacterium]HOS03838.1 cyclic nucleotide-binding domain-containing protein [Candidatus Hydrogenedentota bacterium]